MAPPFKIKHIDHIVLRVANIEKMMTFYREVLGCAFEKDQSAIGLWQLRAGASLIDLISVDGALGSKGGAAPGVEARNLDHFALSVENFDDGAMRAHFEKHGVTVTQSGERYGAEGDGPSIYILDPEGNEVEIKGPPRR
ncbi:MAG: VOC family protein [Alphaproteobacteria bacterium]|nr:VOC family protein [Alphaproteobacteria bacterium]